MLQRRPRDRESAAAVRGGDHNSGRLGRAAAAGRGCLQQEGRDGLSSTAAEEAWPLQRLRHLSGVSSVTGL